MAVLANSQKLDGRRRARPLWCVRRDGLVLAAALLLSSACASHKPSSPEARTQSPPPSSRQATDSASREGRQGGEQARQPAHSPEERSGRRAADETKSVAQAISAQAQRQRAQGQAWASNPRGAAAQGDRQATTKGITSQQVEDSAAAHDARVSVYSGGHTEEEHRQRLDQDLNRSLAEFDERLRREQAELHEQATRAAAQRAARGGGLNSGRQVGLTRATAPPPPDAGAGGGDQPDLAGGERIPSAEDDDVVARQLREAAQNEQDPELRKKLWEEYRAYKHSGG